MTESKKGRKRQLTDDDKEEILLEIEQVNLDENPWEQLMMVLEKAGMFEAKVQKVLSTGFSSFDPKKVMTIFGYSSPSEITELRLPLFRVPQKIIDLAKSQVQMGLRMYGHWTGSSEAVRGKFLDQVLLALASELSFKMDSEGGIESALARGYVEIILKAFGLLIIAIIEAKTEDMTKGRSQLFMELYAGNVLNCNAGALLPMYGAVSTFELTRFIEYSGERDKPFKQTKAIEIQTVEDIPPLVEHLYTVLVRNLIRAAQIVLPLLVAYKTAKPTPPPSPQAKPRAKSKAKKAKAGPVDTQEEERKKAAAAAAKEERAKAVAGLSDQVAKLLGEFGQIEQEFKEAKTDESACAALGHLQQIFAHCPPEIEFDRLRGKLFG